MKVLKPVHTGLALFLGLISLGTPAFADTTYTYTGNPVGAALNGFNPLSCGGPCTITGSFVTASPLGDSFAFNSIVPESYSFTDGIQTYTNTNSSPSLFYVGTDASGDVVNTNIELVIGGPVTPTSGSLIAMYNPPGNGWSSDEIIESGNGAYNLDTGTWAITDTPEPSCLFMLSSGLAGLGFMKRKAFQR